MVRGWTVSKAWAQLHGASPRRLPEDVQDSEITCIDETIASYLGIKDPESLRKIHAALCYCAPLIRGASLPRMPADQISERKHVASVAIGAVIDYATHDNIPRSEWGPVVTAIRLWDFSTLGESGWFLIWDAMGCSTTARGDLESDAFYKWAGQSWHYAAGDFA